MLLLALAVKYPTVVERINNAFIDTQINLLPKTELSALPIIVEVDEKSLSALGQWPWSRYKVARLLEKIHQSGAIAVGIDALFVEPDRTSPVQIQRDLASDLGQNLPLSNIDEKFRDYDAILSQTLGEGPFTLSYFFSFPQPSALPSSCQPKSASGAMVSANTDTSFRQLHRALDIICNVPSIQEGAKSSGFINTSPDSDGIYRKTTLLIEYNNRLYPSLALQTYLTANNLDNFVLSSGDSGLALKVGNKSIPLDKAANLLMKFPAKDQHFKKISAIDVLSGNTAADALQNKIVFIGFSAAGLHEYRPTPVSPQLLGVEFHATIVDNLSRADFLHRPANAQGLELAFTFLLTLCLLIGLINVGPVASVTIPALLIIALLLLSQFLMSETGAVLSPALPIIMTLASFAYLTVVKYSAEYLRAIHLTLLVARTQEGIIGSFCSMSEYRDPETGAHLKRTQEYVKALAKHLQNHPKFKAVLTDEVIELLYKAAPLHDIGKIGIRDHILLKKGRLDEDEFQIMQSHPQIGADIIESVATQIGWNPFMQIAHQICLSHQEKWDGSGYPQALVGEDIPVPARFMALADVYDALISKRVYKPAFPHSMAVALIREGKDNHFDPLIVEAFEAIHEQFRDIALQFLDNDDQKQALLVDRK